MTSLQKGVANEKRRREGAAIGQPNSAYLKGWETPTKEFKVAGAQVLVGGWSYLFSGVAVD